MSSKWIKALVLLFVVVVLLTVAGATAQKKDNKASDTAAATEPDGTVQTEPGGSKGEAHYSDDGQLQKNTVVGSDSEGYIYVGADGKKDSGYCNAVTVNGVKWNVIEGSATRVSDEWDECLHTALTYVGQWTNSSMSREEKLRKAFETIKDDSIFLEGVPDRDGEPYYELDWPVVCANELLVDGMGDCYSYGAAFAFIGKAVGYDECYACTTGGHGWAIIEGRAYDPEWDAHHQEYNHFGVAPEDDCDVSYFDSLTEGVDWMKVKV